MMNWEKRVIEVVNSLAIGLKVNIPTDMILKATVKETQAITIVITKTDTTNNNNKIIINNIIKMTILILRPVMNSGLIIKLMRMQDLNIKRGIKINRERVLILTLSFIIITKRKDLRISTNKENSRNKSGKSVMLMLVTTKANQLMRRR